MLVRNQDLQEALLRIAKIRERFDMPFTSSILGGRGIDFLFQKDSKCHVVWGKLLTDTGDVLLNVRAPGY